MKKNYFILAIQYLGLCLLMSGIFLGANFLVKGVLYISIPVAIVIGALAQIIAINLTKQKRVEKNIHAANKMKAILLGVYFVIFLITLPFFLHFITVSLKNKTQIQNHYEQELAGFNSTMDVFKKETISLRQNIATNKENSSNELDQGTIDQQTDHIVKPLQEVFSEISSKSQDYSNRFKQALTSWNLFTIGSYIDTWDYNKESWETQLTNIFNTVNEENGSIRAPFEPTTTDTESTKDYFTTINWGNAAWLITLLVLLVVHFLVLIEFITTRSKTTGGGRITGTKKLESGTGTW